MRLRIFLLIMGMTLVTYIPRALPAIMVGRLKFSPKAEKFLRLIPYTAMSALIFPGVFTMDPDRVYVGILGAAAAAALAWRKMPVMVCVLGAIAVDLIVYLVV
ncbi:MAG: AzlD domain-containing protein [Clostridiales bacterium]|nr:AzlD domain-containing protein [Clostridiales bacterium]